MHIDELTTPALLVERETLRANLDTMSAALPGDRLRPHVKAHKCSELARRQRDDGHPGFTCATVRECEVLATAGLGGDLLLANEVLDTARLGALVRDGARVTLAVDSRETIAAAVRGGVREVVIDVAVGLPRCGAPPERAVDLARDAGRAGLEVRGVMGYEGHLMMVRPDDERARMVTEAVTPLARVAEELAREGLVASGLVTGGGTGTYRENTAVTEIQAGSYALMDTAYAEQGLPFGQALSVLGTVTSVSDAHAVVDAGLKAMSLDHGNPTVPGAQVWFCSDEHTTFAPEARVHVGDRIRVLPSHVDPTVALHEAMYLVDGDTVLERWPVDMRGW